jgi:hypothetical protein
MPLLIQNPSPVPLIGNPLLRVHPRSKFGKQHAPHRSQIALPLQYAGKPGQVGLEPILFRISIGSKAKIIDL